MSEGRALLGGLHSVSRAGRPSHAQFPHMVGVHVVLHGVPCMAQGQRVGTALGALPLSALQVCLPALRPSVHACFASCLPCPLSSGVDWSLPSVSPEVLGQSHPLSLHFSHAILVNFSVAGVEPWSSCALQNPSDPSSCRAQPSSLPRRAHTSSRWGHFSLTCLQFAPAAATPRACPTWACT